MNAGLAVRNVTAGYGSTVILEDISFELPPGGTLALLGRNGVGKTTLLRTLMGYTTLHRGHISLGSDTLDGAAVHRRVASGLGYVPQGREIFASLSAEENLTVAARPGGFTLDAVYELFPGLAGRRHHMGHQLSGGEQQMLAIGRALVGGPRVLLLDEPLEGLAPIVVESLFARLSELREKLTILLVEQKVDLALAFAAQAIVLERGRIVFQGESAALLRDEAAQGRWLGISR